MDLHTHQKTHVHTTYIASPILGYFLSARFVMMRFASFLDQHGVATCCEGCQDHPDGPEGSERWLCFDEGHSGCQGELWLEVIKETPDKNFEFSKTHHY